MCWHKRRGTSKRWKKKPTKNPKRTLVSNGRDRVVDRSGVVQPRRTGYWMIECFPTSTWRTSGLKELPGHRRAPRNVVEQFARRWS